jgi:alpha-D-ribose 1-methylphosphonate 5-triphosphate diphosphatase PhnM
LKPTTRHGTGQTGEYLVAAELARQGFTVAIPTGNAESIDILAIRDKVRIAVQVKTAGRGNHQFNLGKFLEVRCENDHQEVVRILENLDTKLLIALVFLGDKAGEDQFAWCFMKDFAEFLAQSHKDYLSRNNGKRPGKNPKSLHAAFSRKALQAEFKFNNVNDLLNSTSSIMT